MLQYSFDHRFGRYVILDRTLQCVGLVNLFLAPALSSRKWYHSYSSLPYCTLHFIHFHLFVALVTLFGHEYSRAEDDAVPLCEHTKLPYQEYYPILLAGTSFFCKGCYQYMSSIL